MKFSVSDEYRARAQHCLQQSQLTKDAQLKKYWDDLAAEWLVLTGMHAGHSYTVVAPYSEVENTLRWMLHCDANADEKQIVAENELGDQRLWQPLT